MSCFTMLYPLFRYLFSTGLFFCDCPCPAEALGEGESGGPLYLYSSTLGVVGSRGVGTFRPLAGASESGYRNPISWRNCISQEHLEH